MQISTYSTLLHGCSATRMVLIELNCISELVSSFSWNYVSWFSTFWNSTSFSVTTSLWYTSHDWGLVEFCEEVPNTFNTSMVKLSAGVPLPYENMLLFCALCSLRLAAHIGGWSSLSPRSKLRLSIATNARGARQGRPRQLLCGPLASCTQVIKRKC